MLKPISFDIPHLNVKAGDTQLSLLPTAGSRAATATWVRPGGSGQPDSSVVGTWSNERVFVDSNLHYRATLELRKSGEYSIRFARTERGLLDATDGNYEFKRDTAMGTPAKGQYTFDGPDRFTFTEPRGTATWVRAGSETDETKRIRR